MFVVRGKSGKILGKYKTKAEAARRVAQLAENAARLKVYQFKGQRSPVGGSPRSPGSTITRLKELRRFNRAELIAARGLEPEGRSRQQKYAATTDEFRQKIACGTSQMDTEARQRLGIT